MPRRDALTLAAGAFVAANLLHTADHLRQGTGRLDWEILTGGSTLTVLAFVVLGLALAHHPRTALLAAVVGVAGAVGIAASHLAPHWSALSDPYPDLDVDALSWAIVLLEIAAAALLGAVGLRGLRLSTSAATPASALPRS